MGARAGWVGGMSWTPDRREEAAKLWNDGYSASQIARKLGRGITRNAVIGVIHRSGLSKRSTPSAPARVAAGKALRNRLPAKPKPAPAPRTSVPPVRVSETRTYAPPPTRPLPPAPPSGPGRRTILTIRAGECRWPIGDPAEPGFTLCGCKTEATYCEGHAEIAYDRSGKAEKRKAATTARGLRRELAA